MTSDVQMPTEHPALLALYEHTWNEISRLRDYQWKIAYYFVSLSVGLIIFINTPGVQEYLSCFVRVLLTAAQLLATGFGAYYLNTNHGYLTQQRNVRRRIEEVVRFYDRGVYGPPSLLPEDWKGQRITSRFQRMGLLVPLVTMVVLVQALSIYLLWASTFCAGTPAR